MRTLVAVLICVVLFPAAISNPERTRLPTLSADTVTLREVRRGSELGAVTELGDSRDTLLVERPVDAREGAQASVFVVDDDGVLLRRVPVGYGRGSPSLIQIVSGVSAGDRIVVSDMRAWDAFDRLMLVALSLAPTGSGAQVLGLLTGSVTDTTGLALPGAKVTVSSANVQVSGISDSQGRFEFPGLPAGRYTVTAELIGFDAVVPKDIAVERGRTTVVPLTLRPGCRIDDGLFVDLGLTHLLQEAGLIAHVRITATLPARDCRETGVCVCTEHVVRVLSVAKTADIISPATIRLLQEGAGRLPKERYWRGKKPYAPGQEYIAFLWTDATRAHVWQSYSPMYMFPIRNGRVEFTRSDAPELSDGMPADEFSRVLGVLLARARGGRSRH